MQKLDNEFFQDILVRLSKLDKDTFTKEDLLLLLVLVLKYLKERNHHSGIEKPYCDTQFNKELDKLLLDLGYYV